MQGVHVTTDYFAILGAPVIAGRTFTAAEDSPNGGHVVVLSTDFGSGDWRRPASSAQTFSSTASPIWLWASSVADFVTDDPAISGCPSNSNSIRQDLANYFGVIARLKPGITLPMANAQLKLAADQYRSTFPGTGSRPNSSFGVILCSSRWSATRARLFSCCLEPSV